MKRLGVMGHCNFVGMIERYLLQVHLEGRLEDDAEERRLRDFKGEKSQAPKLNGYWIRRMHTAAIMSECL